MNSVCWTTRFHPSGRFLKSRSALASRLRSAVTGRESLGCCQVNSKLPPEARDERKGESEWPVGRRSFRCTWPAVNPGSSSRCGCDPSLRGTPMSGAAFLERPLREDKIKRTAECEADLPKMRDADKAETLVEDKR